MKLDVITPVGPGHDDVKERAMSSVRIAILTDTGPFEDVRVKMIDDTDGGMGRSAARNAAVRASEADWLFFLDADDLMHPLALGALQTGLDAQFGTILEMHKGCVLERYQVPAIESYADLLEHDPYLTIQIGHFVRREVAQELPFSEDMDTGEDWDYYLRLWRQYNCRKVALPLMVNVRGQHSTGPRSATGQEWTAAVRKMVADARGN